VLSPVGCARRLDNFTAVYISTQYRLVVPLLFLIVIILFRLRALLGRVRSARMSRRKTVLSGTALALSVAFLFVAPFLSSLMASSS